MRGVLPSSGTVAAPTAVVVLVPRHMSHQCTGNEVHAVAACPENIKDATCRDTNYWEVRDPSPT